ncbi:MAG: NlpC/P60 family protein [Lawsonibacter sp.]|jgi:SH3-like domain-containing protein
MHFSKTPFIRFTAGLLLVSNLIAPSMALTGTVNSGASPLRLRSEANTEAEVLTKLNHGTQVEVLSSAENGWYQISYRDITGYVSSQYLVVDAADDAVSAAAAPAPTAAPAQEPVVTAYAEPKYGKVTASSLNIRASAGTDSDKVGSLSIGKVVEILGECDGWYQIENGYISSDYVTLVDAAEAASSGKGQEIADYAMTFVGYPYVYGGSSPSGFDCSGFTKYIYSQFGYSINRTASNQLDNGTSVSMSELQPGDLVFFKKSGSGSKRASHVGIYIGDNQFVHASTSTVGVIVSELSEAYYTTGFVGGRRLV